MKTNIIRTIKIRLDFDGFFNAHGHPKELEKYSYGGKAE